MGLGEGERRRVCVIFCPDSDHDRWYGIDNSMENVMILFVVHAVLLRAMQGRES